MIVHKLWRVRGPRNSQTVYWDREGWFLFSIIPLYVRTTHHHVIEYV